MSNIKVPSGHDNQVTFVYILKHTGGEYVGITSDVKRRLKEHRQTKMKVKLLDSFGVQGRRQAEGIEATLHNLQKEGEVALDYLSPEFAWLHSIWFHSECKGFPKHFTQKPILKF